MIHISPILAGHICADLLHTHAHGYVIICALRLESACVYIFGNAYYWQCVRACVRVECLHSVHVRQHIYTNHNLIHLHKRAEPLYWRVWTGRHAHVDEFTDFMLMKATNHLIDHKLAIGTVVATFRRHIGQRREPIVANIGWAQLDCVTSPGPRITSDCRDSAPAKLHCNMCAKLRA